MNIYNLWCILRLLTVVFLSCHEVLIYYFYLKKVCSAIIHNEFVEMLTRISLCMAEMEWYCSKMYEFKE